MSGKTLCSALAIVALALVATTSASGLSAPEVIRVLDHTDTFVTDPPDLFSRNATPPVGARFLFHDTLYAWAGTKRGDRVGRLEGLCTFTGTAGNAVTTSCTATAFLPAGQILIAGSPRFSEGPSNNVVAVVGGTGRKQRARLGEDQGHRPGGQLGGRLPPRPIGWVSSVTAVLVRSKRGI